MLAVIGGHGNADSRDEEGAVGESEGVVGEHHHLHGRVVRCCLRSGVTHRCYALHQACQAHQGRVLSDDKFRF